jgi:hypothetical protein
MEHDERNRYEAVIMQQEQLIADLNKRLTILRDELKHTLAEPTGNTTLVVELDKPVKLRNGQTVEVRVTTPAPPATFSIGHPPIEEESAEVWVLRLCDLVGQDGSNERGRLEAFALLHDAVKPPKTRQLVWTTVIDQLQYVNLPSKNGEFDAKQGLTTLRVGPNNSGKYKWCWDLTSYGLADTEEDAKAAVIEAAGKMR